jgi:hypothetical protein
LLLCGLVVEVGVLVEKVTPELVETCAVEVDVALTEWPEETAVLF